MLRYSRHIHVEAEGSDVKIVRTGHYQADEPCESSLLYQHVMLGAQNEFQNWLKRDLEAALDAEVAPDAVYARRELVHGATRWTKDLSTEVLLLLAADDKTLVEYRGDWSAGQPVVEIIRLNLKADILITLSILWVDTCRELLSKPE